MILKQSSLEEFQQLVRQAKAGKKKMAPIWLEASEDMMTPVLAFLTLHRPGQPAFLFESVTGGERIARWSYLGFNPFRTLVCRGKDVSYQEPQRDYAYHIHGENDPRQALARQLELFSTLKVPGLPPFCGGLVGNVGYDTVRLVEPSVPDSNPDDLDLPDIQLMYFNIVVAFDHVFKKIYLIHLAEINGDGRLEYERCLKRLQEIAEQLLRPRFLDLVPGTPVNGISSNMSTGQCKKMVRRCKEYITAGDAFQIVVSQRFSCPLTVDPFNIYRCLRQTNPAPYLFYLDFGEWKMVGSSPEIMVEVTGRQVKISPIAGTRPRGKTEAEDADLAAELMADQK